MSEPSGPADPDSAQVLQASPRVLIVAAQRLHLGINVCPALLQSVYLRLGALDHELELLLTTLPMHAVEFQVVLDFRERTPNGLAA